MEMLVAHRPAIILEGEYLLDQEFRATRWAHHRLLDFEQEHQDRIDQVRNSIVPSLVRVHRILGRLTWRKRNKPRSLGFIPKPRPELEAHLTKVLKGLKDELKADPRWKEVLNWANQAAPDAPIKACRRKAGETDEEFDERSAKQKRRSRREDHRIKVIYPQIRCFYHTWNQLCKSVDQARSAVLQQRKKGLPAQIRRPRYQDSQTLVVDKPGPYKIVERGSLWWTIEMRLFDNQWVRFKTKIGNWHPVSDSATFKTLQLVRRKDGNGWSYSVSLLIDGVEKRSRYKETGVVALDWGHREHAHDNQNIGMRVFYWRGEDGREGEILLPKKCRTLTDKINVLKSRADTLFDTRKAAQGITSRNRYSYRGALRKLQVLTKDQSDWIRWETRIERQISACRKRIDNIRNQTYMTAVQELRKHYKTFVLEDETIVGHRKLDTDEMTRRRKRQNRELSARYQFKTICERLGATLVEVSAYNSTRECPDPGCDGLLEKNGPELLVACPVCGTIRDKDQGAAIVILRRGKEALLKLSESA